MPLPPNFQKLLDGCQEMQLSHLRPLVDRMFENADVALLDFAEKAENNVAQSYIRCKRKGSLTITYVANVKRGSTHVSRNQVAHSIELANKTRTQQSGCRS